MKMVVTDLVCSIVMSPFDWECRSCGNVARNGDVGYHGFVAPESYRERFHAENG